MRKGRIKLKNCTIAAVSFLALAVIVFLLLTYTSERKLQPDYEELDDHWEVEINGKQYQDVTLSNFTFPVTNKGDVIQLTRVLDRKVRVQNPVLRMYSIHSVVEVYMNNAMIYGYGREDYKEGKLLGYGYQYIPLPQGYQGHEIRIVLTVSENNAFTGIQSMRIANERNMLQQVMSGDRIRLAVALFLIVFGVLVGLITTVMIVRDISFARLFYIALFSLLIGCWTLCNNDLISYFTQDLKVKVYMEYLCVYALPIPMLLYFYEPVHEKSMGKWLLGSYWILLIVQIAFFLYALSAQLLNYIHFPAFLVFAHVVMMLDILFVIVLAIMSLKKKGSRIRCLRSGVSIVLVFILFELIRYNVDKYIRHFEGNQYNSTLCFGALAVVGFLMLDYTGHIKRGLFRQAQQKLLEKMAYTDELTGLFNRRKCDETLEQYQKERRQFALISMDLNLLKHYNDCYGHERGDELLRCFAGVLNDTFPEDALKARFGGDEFMVLIPFSDEKKTRQLVTRLRVNMERENASNSHVQLSSAIGYVCSSELEDEQDIHRIYNEADHRMYEDKRSMKAELQRENVEK